MKKINNKLIYFFIILPSIVCGYIISRLIFDIPFFSLSKEINAVNLVSIMINLILAFWITNVLNKQKEENRIGKNLLIDKINNIVLQIDSITTQVKSKSINWSQASSEIKRINMSIKNIFEFITYSKFVVNGYKLVEFNEIISELRDLMTNTPIIDESTIKELNISVRDGVIKYAENQVILIEQKTDYLKSKLIKLQLEINIS